MWSERFVRTSGLLGGAPASVVAALGVAVLAGVGSAAAAAHRPGILASGRVTTVAGGVGGPAKATRVAVAVPCGVSFGGGNMHIAAGATVRAVAPATDRLNTPAGTGTTAGPLGDGGPAVKATVSACGVAVDHSGNLVIADTANNRIRVVAKGTGTFYGLAMTAGDIYTVAGTGTAGFSGDGGLATSAEVSGPDGVTVDASGNLVIADTANNRIRVVAASTGTFYGQAMTAGDIYTVAGTGTAGFSGDSGPATAAQVASPWRTAVDASGNLVIADTANNRIRVVAASTGTFYGQAMTADDIYTVAGNGTSGFSGDGGPATSARVTGPEGVSLDGSGNLLIADTKDHRVRAVAATTGTFYGQAMTAGDIYTIAGDGVLGFGGDGGPATSAELSAADVAVDASGNVLIADPHNVRVRAVAASTGTFYGQAMTAGDIYSIVGDGTAGFLGDGSKATKAELNLPDGVAVDSHGNVLIADTANNRVRVVAASTGTFYGQAMTIGDIYTIAGNGTAGFSGDTGPATSAELSAPQGAAFDAAKNLLIADTSNSRIRVVAASTGTFYGQAMNAGDIYTIAGDGTAGFGGDGGPATSARLHFPGRVVVDSSGNTVIGDTTNNRIRVVAATTGNFYGQAMTAGDIYSIAGTGAAGFSGDGPGPSTELSAPEGVAVTSTGDLLIADSENDRIRMIAH